MGDVFRMGAKLPMDQYGNYGTILPNVCNFINHEKSEKHQYNELQQKAKQDLISIAKIVI